MQGEGRRNVSSATPTTCIVAPFFVIILDLFHIVFNRSNIRLLCCLHTQHAPQSLCNLPIVINLKGVFTPNIDTVNILKTPVINFPFPSSPCSHVQTMCKSPIRTRGKRRKSFQRNVVTFLKLFLWKYIEEMIYYTMNVHQKLYLIPSFMLR